MNMLKKCSFAVMLFGLLALKAPAELIITEIMNAGGTANTLWQFVEVYNSGSGSVKLGSVFGSGDTSFINKNGTAGNSVLISAGEVAVLYSAAESASAFKTEWRIGSNVKLIPITIWTGLDPVGSLALYPYPSGVPLAGLSYGGPGWPTPNNNSSIYYSDLFSYTGDPSSGGSWSLSTIGGGDWTGWQSAHGLAGSPGMVPEPATIGLALMALVGGAGVLRRRKAKQTDGAQPAVA